MAVAAINGFGQSKTDNTNIKDISNYTVYLQSNLPDSNKTKFNSFTIDGGINKIKDIRGTKNKAITVVYTKQGNYRITTYYKTGKLGGSVLTKQIIFLIK